MRALGLAFIPVLSCTSGAPLASASPRAETGVRVEWNFDRGTAGSIPAGASAFAGRWAVQAESDAPSSPNALCQTGSDEFPAIALSTERRENVGISAKFKPISGRRDQAAGVIFRVQDKDNYYIVRANALEANVNIFKYREFLDAVAMGMITPGPVVITAVFVGYLVAGLAGATAAGIGVFLPPYLMVVLFAPRIVRWRKHPAVQGFTKSATSAAAGAIVGAAAVISTQVLVDVPRLAIFLLALGILWRFKVPEPALVGASAVAGLVLSGPR